MAATAFHRSIPLVYRVYFLWFEPLLALNGAFMSAFKTDEFLSVMTPLATPLALNPVFHVVFDQLAATYFLFAFNEAVVLRLSSDLRVWKAALLGIACCDLLHVYATGRALGFEALVNPSLWRVVDGINLALLYVPCLLRLSFIFEVGFPQSLKAKKA
jgi:hypothetical protein